MDRRKLQLAIMHFLEPWRTQTLLLSQGIHGTTKLAKLSCLVASTRDGPETACPSACNLYILLERASVDEPELQRSLNASVNKPNWSTPGLIMHKLSELCWFIHASNTARTTTSTKQT